MEGSPPNIAKVYFCLMITVMQKNCIKTQYCYTIKSFQEVNAPSLGFQRGFILNPEVSKGGLSPTLHNLFVLESNTVCTPMYIGIRDHK